MSNQLVDRVASQYLRSKTAGEVRFIKDRGGDSKEWGWDPPGAFDRKIDPEYEWKTSNAKPLAQVLRAALMAMGHAQSATSTFNKIKSQQISPDGSLGGKGYVLTIKDIRRQLTNVVEALSSVTDTIHDELQAPHWRGVGVGENSRARDELKDIMGEVEDLKKDPEGWAEEEEEGNDHDDENDDEEK